MQVKITALHEGLGKKGLLPEEIEGIETEVVVRPVENEFFCKASQVVLVVEDKAVVVTLADLESVVAAFKIQIG
jgi:hypothetical protein